MVKRKYKFLTNSFFEGSIKSQINTIYRDRVFKPEKVIEFRRALRNGDCKINLKDLSKHQLNKVIELGVYGEVLKFEEKKLC